MAAHHESLRRQVVMVTAALVTITGPIASGKNTVADLVADHCILDGFTVVIADLDDVAAMVAKPGAAASGLWSAANQAHGALVVQWVLSEVDIVISVGPIYSQAEQDALFGRLPVGTKPLRVLIDAPLEVTWQRVSADENRGLSRQRDFHATAHARFRNLMPNIPADLLFDSGNTSAGDIARAIYDAISFREQPRP
jgi:hypothetical protein